MQKVAVAALLWGACFAQDAARPPGWVVIPVNEYQALRGRAYPTDRDPGTPVDATLTKIDYDLRVSSARVSGRAIVTVDVLKDGWVRVPIPAGLMVRESRMDGHAVALTPVPGGSGQLAAILPHRGRSVLSLDVSFPIVASGGEERLSLPSGASGITRASINLNANPDLDVHVGGGFMAEKTASHWLAYARGTEPLLFTWRKKAEEHRAELPLRMRGSLIQFFGLGEDSSTLNAEVQIDVLQGSAAQVKLAVPASITINQVPGATVADWDVKDGALTVNFLEPADHSVRFSISAETRLPRDGAITIPLVSLLGSERDTGGVAVDVLGAGEIKDTKPQGLDPVEGSELGPMIAGRQSPSLAAFRMRAGAAARSLDVVVARYTQQAVLTANIEEARYRVLASIDGKLLVQARYAVRNNQRSFLKVTLPAGASVWSSSVAGRAVRAGLGPDSSLLFPLTKSRAGEEAPVFVVELLYLARAAAWDGKGRATVALPAVDLPVSRSGLLLYYPPAFRVTAETGAFRTQTFEPPASEILNGNSSPQPAEAARSASGTSSLQALVDGYRARGSARRNAADVPSGIAFPAVGPSLFLVSELSGENKAGTVVLNYEKDKKGGLQ